MRAAIHYNNFVVVALINIPIITCYQKKITDITQKDLSNLIKS